MENQFIYLLLGNKENEVYKALYDQIVQDEKNMAWQKEKLKELIPYEWHEGYNRPYQQTFNRMPEYFSFKFECPRQDIDLKAWREESEHPGFYVPNLRSKSGKEKAKLLDLINNRGARRYDFIYQYFGVSQLSGRFSFPFIFFYHGRIYVRLCINISTWKSIDGFNEITITAWENDAKAAINTKQINKFK